MNLYEISVDYRRFQEQVESGEIPEEAIADTLEAIEGNFDDKVDSIACIIKSLLAEAKEINEKRSKEVFEDECAKAEEKAESFSEEPAAQE